MVDTALSLTNGEMPILLRLEPLDLVDAAAYLRGKHRCKAIVLEPKNQGFAANGGDDRSGEANAR
jgi:hypothetical protein